MKQFVRCLVLVAVAVFAWSCARELPGGEGSGVVYASVDAGVKGDDGGDTRSVINIDAENFNKAVLFAFNPSTGKVMTYGPEAGQASGQPIVMQTTSQSFAWVLPLQTAIDFYVLANYGDLNVQALLNKGTNLKKSDLDGLVFSCANVADLRALNESGYGIPMAGKLSIDASTIMTGAESLTFKVKRLFAKFTFSIDASYFTNQGANVEVVHIYSRNVNTEVPYFTEGFKQTSANKLVMLDHGTVSDLAQLNLMNPSSSITLYFPENCQGNKTGAAHWYDVANNADSMSPGGMGLCSYIDLLVRISVDGLVSYVSYLIYLGTDCTTNFDVGRNKVNSLHLNLQNTPKRFEFSQKTKAFAASEAVTLNYTTTLSEEEIAFEFKGAQSGIDYTYSFQTKDISTSRAIFITSGLESVTEDIICKGGKIVSEDDSVSDECRLVNDDDEELCPVTFVQRSSYRYGWSVVDLPNADNNTTLQWGYINPQNGNFVMRGGTHTVMTSWKDYGNGAYFDKSNNRLYLMSAYDTPCLRVFYSVDYVNDDNEDDTYTIMKVFSWNQRSARVVPRGLPWQVGTSDSDTHVYINVDDGHSLGYYDCSFVLVDGADASNVGVSLLDPVQFQIPLYARRTGYEYMELVYATYENDSEDPAHKVRTEIVDEDPGGGTFGYLHYAGVSPTVASDDIWYSYECGLSPYSCVFHFNVTAYQESLNIFEAIQGPNVVSQMQKSGVSADGSTFYLAKDFMQSFFVEHEGCNYNITVGSSSVSNKLSYQKTQINSTVDRVDFWMNANIPITDETEPPYGYAGDESDFDAITITFKTVDNTITRRLYCKLLNKRFSYRIGYNGYQMETAPRRTVIGRDPAVNELRADGDSYLRFNMWNPLRLVFDFDVNGFANGIIEYKPSVAGSTTSRTVSNSFTVPVTSREPKSENQGGCPLEEVRSGIFGGITSSVVNCLDVVRSSCENHHNYYGFPSGSGANYASHWNRHALPYEVEIRCSFSMDTFKSNQPGLSYRGNFNSGTIFKYITPYNYNGPNSVSPIGDFKYVYYDAGFYTHDWVEWGDRERVVGETDGDHVLLFGFNQNSSARPQSPVWQYDKQVLKLKLNGADSWSTMVTAIGN
jgi:hypothetical protein